MSGRLASFKGPSTPSSSPVAAKSPAASPSRAIESTYHRKIRSALQELRAITETWDDLVLLDGLKAARSLVDTRTDLECVLCTAASPPESTPRPAAMLWHSSLMASRATGSWAPSSP